MVVFRIAFSVVCKEFYLKKRQISFILLSGFRERSWCHPERSCIPLGRIKQLVARGRYRYSQKVRDFIAEGFFDEEDLVHCILSATGIHKSERDELGQAVHGMKFVILGRDTHGRPFYTVGKVIRGAGGQFYFYISAHQADEDC